MPETYTIYEINRRTHSYKAIRRYVTFDVARKEIEMQNKKNLKTKRYIAVKE